MGWLAAESPDKAPGGTSAVAHKSPGKYLAETPLGLSRRPAMQGHGSALALVKSLAAWSECDQNVVTLQDLGQVDDGNHRPA